MTITSLKTLLLSVVFLIPTLNILGTNNTDTLNIFLIRHAKVIIDRPLFCTSKKAEELLLKYNTQPIENFDPMPVKAKIDVEDYEVYTSRLPRAIETSNRIFQLDSFHQNAVFNEYSMRMIDVPLIPLPYKFWSGISRGFWYLHLNNDGESRKEAKDRMRMATDYLIALTKKNKSSVLVAHGLLIRDMRKELKRRGWKMIFKNGNGNLAVTKFQLIFQAKD